MLPSRISAIYSLPPSPEKKKSGQNMNAAWQNFVKETKNQKKTIRFNWVNSLTEKEEALRKYNDLKELQETAEICEKSSRRTNGLCCESCKRKR